MLRLKTQPMELKCNLKVEEVKVPGTGTYRIEEPVEDILMEDECNGAKQGLQEGGSEEKHLLGPHLTGHHTFHLSCACFWVAGRGDYSRHVCSLQQTNGN